MLDRKIKHVAIFLKIVIISMAHGDGPCAMRAGMAAWHRAMHRAQTVLRGMMLASPTDKGIDVTGSCLVCSVL